MAGRPDIADFKGFVTGVLELEGGLERLGIHRTEVMSGFLKGNSWTRRCDLFLLGPEGVRGHHKAAKVDEAFQDSPTMPDFIRVSSRLRTQNRQRVH